MGIWSLYCDEGNSNSNCPYTQINHKPYSKDLKQRKVSTFSGIKSIHLILQCPLQDDQLSTKNYKAYNKTKNKSPQNQNTDQSQI